MNDAPKPEVYVDVSLRISINTSINSWIWKPRRGYAPFHFHRLFLALMGETLGANLRRRRCEVAATRLLAQPKLSRLQTCWIGFRFRSLTARLAYRWLFYPRPGVCALPLSVGKAIRIRQNSKSPIRVQ